MKYTNEQIRGAILRAADRIEREPSCYRFQSIGIPDCGTSGCMWGWIAFEMGNINDWDIGPTCETVTGKSLFEGAQEHLYAFSKTVSEHLNYQDKPLVAAACLRAYADKYFPVVSPIVPEDRQLVPWSACDWRPSHIKAKACA